jgi:ribosomal protein L44E
MAKSIEILAEKERKKKRKQTSFRGFEKGKENNLAKRKILQFKTSLSLKCFFFYRY